MGQVMITNPADLKDQHWLDTKIEQIEMGVEAVVEIARNWSDGRHLARLHPGVSAAQYVTERVGVLGKSVVPVLLAESNWSHRQIATVAGVHHTTVGRIATGANAPVEHYDNPATWQVGHDYSPRPTLGADGKERTYTPRVVQAVVIDTPVEPEPVDATAWPALRQFIEGSLAFTDTRTAAEFAAAVPHGSRDKTARSLRRVGRALGEIALILEGSN